MRFNSYTRAGAAIALLIALLPGCSTVSNAISLTRNSSTHDTVLSSKEQANACLQTGLNLAASEKDEHAIAQLRKARELNPGLTGVAHPLAVLYDRQGRFGQAEQEYARAIEESPTADVLNDYGYFLYSQGRADKAEEWLNRAIHAAPGHKKATINLAMVAAAQGNYDRAFELFEPVVGKAAAHQNLGLLMLRSGQDRDALPHLEQAAALDPSLQTSRAVVARFSTKKDAAGVMPASHAVTEK